MECIILAGGLGTRLRGIIGDAPKCMATVIGRPFLYYLFRDLAAQGCTRVVLSLGYKHDAVVGWLRREPPPFGIDWVIEEVPLGTGGGIRLALTKAVTDEVFVLNGDTMFEVPLREMSAFAQARSAECTLALKRLQHFERYGSVTISDDTDGILSFEEKKPVADGLINGGIYLINKPAFFKRDFPEKFSFEKEYLERFVGENIIYGFQSDGYFIDIGIPEDYDRAGHDFKILFPA